MILRTISKIREDSPFSLLCKVVKVRVDDHKRFLVLRVKDSTRCVVHFRKFNLDKLEQEIYSEGLVEVWKIFSKQVDVVVSFPPEEVIPTLQKGVVLCIWNLECRAVPSRNFTAFVYELYTNMQLGGQLVIMPCNDLGTCRGERLFRDAETEEFPYIGTITFAQIRKGLSFSLLCEVIQCRKESSTNQVVLRLRDSTLTKIRTKKHDFDNLDNRGQNSDELSFHKSGSPEVDVVVTSLSQDIGDMDGEIVSLGPVVCDIAPSFRPPPVHLAIHTLYVDATHPSFQLVPRDAKEQATINMRRKLSKPPKMKNKKRKSRLRHNTVVNLEPCEGPQGAVGLSDSCAVESGVPAMSQESFSSNIPSRRSSHSEASSSTVSGLELSDLSKEFGSSDLPSGKRRRLSEASDSSVLDLEMLEVSQEVVSSDLHLRSRKSSESSDVIVLDVDLFDTSDSSSR